MTKRQSPCMDVMSSKSSFTFDGEDFTTLINDKWRERERERGRDMN